MRRGEAIGSGEMSKALQDRAVRVAPHVVVTLGILCLLAAIAFWIVGIWTPEWTTTSKADDPEQIWYYGADNRWLYTGWVLFAVSVLAAIGRFCMWQWDKSYHCHH
jgi:TRAP-type C4-dicarboxylate transport system permease small subunit